MATFSPSRQFRKRYYRPDVIKLILEQGDVPKALAAADKALGKLTDLTDGQGILPPRVRITSPQAAGQPAQRSEIQVRAIASPMSEHPVASLTLLLNGRPYGGQAPSSAWRNPPSARCGDSWTVQFSPGRHRLQVLADSAVSQGHSETLEVVYIGEEPAEPELPNLYVLAVGVASYPDDSLKLNYAARDAEAIAKVFEEKAKPLFKKVEAKLLLDKQATRADVLKALSWLRKEMTSKDYAVVFFSGHGDKDSDGSLYFLPYDVDTKDLLSTAVPSDQFKKRGGAARQGGRRCWMPATRAVSTAASAKVRYR